MVLVRLGSDPEAVYSAGRDHANVANGWLRVAVPPVAADKLARVSRPKWTTPMRECSGMSLDGAGRSPSGGRTVSRRITADGHTLRRL